MLAKQQHPQTNVIGADDDRSILLLATEKAHKAGVAVKFDQAMSHELPYPDESFDRVLTSLFFHH